MALAENRKKKSIKNTEKSSSLVNSFSFCMFTSCTWGIQVSFFTVFQNFNFLQFKKVLVFD